MRSLRVVFDRLCYGHGRRLEEKAGDSGGAGLSLHAPAFRGRAKTTDFVPCRLFLSEPQDGFVKPAKFIQPHGVDGRYGV